MKSRLVEADYSDVELRILGHIRAAGLRDHEAEARRKSLKETALVLMLVAAVAIWSFL